MLNFIKREKSSLFLIKKVYCEINIKFYLIKFSHIITDYLYSKYALKPQFLNLKIINIYIISKLTDLI